MAFSIFLVKVCRKEMREREREIRRSEGDSNMERESRQSVSYLVVVLSVRSVAGGALFAWLSPASYKKGHYYYKKKKTYFNLKSSNFKV